MKAAARHSASAESAKRPDLLDRLLFFVLLAILAARPLLSETFERVDLSFVATSSSGPTPATTTWLDAGVLLASVALWTRRRERTSRVVLIGLACLASATLLSTWAAGEKRVALNAAAHLFIAALGGCALVSLIRQPWMGRVLLAAMLASGCANAAKCMMQRAYEFDETADYWQQQKAGLAANGVDVNNPDIVNYERRLRSQDAFGYQSHPNVAAACLSMAALAAGGVAAAALRRKSVAGLPSISPAVLLLACVLVVLPLSAIPLTGSTGALLATSAAALVLLVVGLSAAWIATYPGKALAIAVGGYVLALGLIAGHGLFHGTLPGASLAFRWGYWTAAAEALPEHVFTGLGRENFVAAHMRYKAPDAAEEVRNPHNLWVSLLVEMGPLGLVGGALVLGAALCLLLRRLVPASRTDELSCAVPRRVIYLAPIAVLLVQALGSETPLASPAMALLWAVELGGVWIACFFAAHWAIVRLSGPAGATWIVAGALAAFAAALIHNVIDFSLLTPAGTAMAVALIAAAAGLCPRGPESAGMRGPTSAPSLANRWLRSGMALAMLAAYVIFIAFPTSSAQSLFTRMREAVATAGSPRDLQRARALGERAVAADRLDAGMPRSLAEIAWQLGARPDAPADWRREWLVVAFHSAEIAAQRGGPNVQTARLLARIDRAKVEIAPDAQSALAGLQSAARRWKSVTALYPNSLRDHFAAGSAFLELFLRTNDAADARRARAHLQTALEIDRTRGPGVAAKLRPTELEEIDQMLRALLPVSDSQPGRTP